MVMVRSHLPIKGESLSTRCASVLVEAAVMKTNSNRTDFKLFIIFWNLIINTYDLLIYKAILKQSTKWLLSGKNVDGFFNAWAAVGLFIRS
jgi:hypothetical protein